MEHQHAFNQFCSVCGCNNPLLEVLKDELAKHAEKTLQAAASLVAPAASGAKSVIFSGGTIRPMINGATAAVEALGISGGHVVAQGSLAQVQDYLQKQKITPTRITLKADQVLLPGFIEPHVHIVPTALMACGEWLDLGPFDKQDLLTAYDFEYIRQKIQNALESSKSSYGDNKWLLGHTVDPALMPFTPASDTNPQATLQEINYQQLDSVSSDVPILLVSASMHTLYLNTPALIALYNKSNKLKNKYQTVEEYISETNGLLQEKVQMMPALAAIPEEQLSQMLIQMPEQVKNMFMRANAMGVTMMYDAGMSHVLQLGLSKKMDLHPHLMRVGAALTVESQEDADKLPNYKTISHYENVYFSHVKIVSDGSNQGLTGYQLEQYCCNKSNNFGVFNFPENGTAMPQETPPSTTTPSNYTNMVSTVMEKGWPIMIHANGDVAVSYALQALSCATPSAGLRHRIEHCSLLTPSTLGQMQQYGVSPSFLIGHVGYWGHVFKEAIFLQKADQLDLCQSSIDHGLKLTLHSDNAVTPLGPLRMMEQAITRIMEGAPDPSSADAVLMPSECLTPEQALTAITYDAAWQCNAENWFGSLAVGHYADFVILDKDPLTMGSSEKSNYENYYKKIRNIPIYQTWVGGVLAFSSETNG